VSSTILMAIVLVIMWLVVLVPMFVRHGEDRAELRSVDRFATAMRVLSRRTPSSGVAGRRRYATAPPAPYADGTSPIRTAARERMLRRRRRTLAVLAGIALLAVPAARALSPWLWLAQVPAVVLLVGYVGWLRTQVRREYERRARRAALFGEAASARPGPVSHAVRRTGRVAAAVAAEEASEAADRSWRPVPVPTPTYVTAPVARRPTESTVDLDDDDLTFTDLEANGRERTGGRAYARARAVNE
jgi:hypothetical protein